jgi:hypothetical protein
MTDLVVAVADVTAFVSLVRAAVNQTDPKLARVRGE